MASNEALIKTVCEIAEKLGIDIDTSEMKNKDLVSLVSDLRAKEQDAENETQADEVEEVDEVEVVEAVEETGQPEVKEHCFVVADGKSITSRRGIICAGEKVEAKDFSDDDAPFNNLVEKGYVVGA